MKTFIGELIQTNKISSPELVSIVNKYSQDASFKCAKYDNFNTLQSGLEVVQTVEAPVVRLTLPNFIFNRKI